MTAPLPPHSSNESRVKAGRVWGGGLATALVAAGVALVGLLVIRGVLDIPVLTPSDGDPLFNEAAGWLPALSAVAALVATGVLHLLMLSTPSPRAFFGWIVVLAVAVIVLRTFMTEAELLERAASGALYIVIGVAIFSLLSGVASNALPSRSDHYRSDYYRPDQYPPGHYR